MTRPLVMFGEDWGGLPSSTQHLARHFAISRRVVWVNSMGLRRPKLSTSDVRRAGKKIARMVIKRGTSSGQATAIPEGMSIVNPRAISWPGSRLARRINRRLIGSQLRETLAGLGIERPVLWTSLPSAVDVVGEISEASVVYYCCDDFESLSGVDHGPVGTMERELAKKADLIFATSEELGRKFKDRHLENLPHGVDFDLFSTPTSRPIDLPPGQVALFYGSLSSWLDLEIVRGLARMRPDWNLVLIGSSSIDLSCLELHGNIHILGPRPHHLLPGYVQHADAALLPFLDTPQIRACNPLKLREYLASGTPVISTDFPALARYRTLISVATDASEFSSALDGLENCPSARAARQAMVSTESWKSRADTALAHIDALPVLPL